MSHVGVVVIGRNEGERLARCLRSVIGADAKLIYVDSGSADGSAALARGLGIEVVELGPPARLTAALARNAGLARLLAIAPVMRHVQFVDGDCEVIEGWIEAASRALDGDDSLVAVCGRLRERHRGASLYNRLCDIEWNGPVGPIAACGGISMMRIDRLNAVGGFDPKVIAAEDDELCLRLRLRGWRIVRIAHDMAWHDASMTRFGQWWTRAVRAGHAYRQVSALHRRGPLRCFAREMRRAWTWGVIVPLVVVAAGAATRGWGLLLAAVYPLNVGRQWLGNRRRGMSWSDAGLYAASCVLGVFPNVQGMLTFDRNRLRGQPSTIIEYKKPPGRDHESVRE